MTARVAINGFGRIGRLGLRTILERHKKDLTIVAINDMADLSTNAHLFRYDSTYGIFPGTVEVGEGILKIDGQNISVMNQKDPSRLPWRQIERRHCHRVNRCLHGCRSGAGSSRSRSEKGDHHRPRNR